MALECKVQLALKFQLVIFSSSEKPGPPYPPLAVVHFIKVAGYVNLRNRRTSTWNRRFFNGGSGKKWGGFSIKNEKTNRDMPESKVSSVQLLFLAIKQS